MTMPDLQLLNLNLIKNVEDTAGFLTQKRVSPLFLKNKKCANHLLREPANENKHFKETKTLITNSYSD